MPDFLIQRTDMDTYQLEALSDDILTSAPDAAPNHHTPSGLTDVLIPLNQDELDRLTAICLVQSGAWEDPWRYAKIQRHIQTYRKHGHPG